MSDWYDKFLTVSIAIMIVIFISLIALVAVWGWATFFGLLGGGA